jgi:outer membrane protein assembly factor BamD (BamD/ComL family)
MKRLLVLGIVLIPIGTAKAKTPEIHCPGDNTVEMRYCAGISAIQASAKLKKMISRDQFKQWQEVTRAMCAKAYAPYKEGTIYPQLAVGCEDHLNHAMLKEFEPLGN